MGRGRTSRSAPPPRPQTANDMSSSRVIPSRTVIQYDVLDILSELENARARDAHLAASGFSTNQAPSQPRSLLKTARRGHLLGHARRRSTYEPVLELPSEEKEADRVALLRNSSLDIDEGSPRPVVTATESQTHTLSNLNPSSALGMSRANRPNHIPMPAGSYAGRSPTGSPVPTPSGNPGSPTSPRGSFLPSFMRTRSRAATLTGNRGRASPTTETNNPLGPSTNSHSTRPQTGTDLSAVREGASVTRSVSTPQNTGSSTTSAPAPAPAPAPVPAHPQVPPPAAAATTEMSLESSSPSKTFRIRLVPHLESTRSLAFDPVIRELHPLNVPAGTVPATAAASITGLQPAVNGRVPAVLLKLGRFTEKTPAPLPVPNGRGAGSSTNNHGIGQGPVSHTLTISGGGGDICSNKVAFKSKVVSRTHAEIWCEEGGKFFIKDTSSSSGTFLNHIRLSSPSTESRPTQISDGDVLQLGVDYQGGHEDQFRCVKMRVELGREWQRGANEFNTNAMKQLKALGGAASTPDSKGKANLAVTPNRKGKSSVTDCCICLFSVTVCQSLFIAPCSHVFHYKCIRPLLMQHHPGFSCPLCRTFANLEEDVETEDAWELASRRASNISRHTSLHSVHPSPDHLRDLPITGPFGATTSASELGVDMAVEPEHTANGDPSPPVQLAAPLERQDTAVQPQGEPPQLRHSGSGTRPEAVQEQDEAIGTSTSNDTQLNTAPSSAFIFVPRDSFNTAPEETAAMPMNSNNPFLNSFSQAATPMNETFLSTLAPGMHQRLELAQAIESGSGPNAAEGAGGGVEEVNGDMMDMELDEQRMRTERSAPESSSALDEQQARARALRSGEVEDMAME